MQRGNFTHKKKHENEMEQNTTLKLKPQLTTTTNVKQIADSYSNETNSEIKSLPIQKKIKKADSKKRAITIIENIKTNK